MPHGSETACRPDHYDGKKAKHFPRTPLLHAVLSSGGLAGRHITTFFGK